MTSLTPGMQSEPTFREKKSFKDAFKKGVRQWLKVLPFVILGFIGTSVFVIYPLVKGIIMSFQDYKIMPGQKSEWVGFAHYVDAFTDPIKSRAFFQAIKNTILNTVFTVPINWFLAVFFAVLINAKFVKYKIAFRTIYYLPIITSWIVVAYLFRFLFAAGENGIVNFMLLNVGIIDTPINWLGNYWTAMMVIWTFHIWKTVGWGIVIYLAALQGIPKSLYEAANIDGANGIQQFRFITLPMLAPVTIFIVINLIMGAFNIFPQVYFLTKGGPMGQTEVLPSLIYKQAFTSMNFGYASAMGVMMGLTIFIITYTQMRKIGKQKFL
ncbi:carbohydrate ABC transporter permease [Marinicrinis sediminis]|uniref:Carbohydrate ABC transporter permease n=1 Tax=Marinicrinis sediminis TaxID=1652465 RepID=A0ABW5R8G8_9BACL